MKRKIFTAVVVLSFMVVSGICVFPAAAQEDTAQLKKKIDMLEKRVAELEALQSGPSDTDTVGYGNKLPDEEWNAFDDMRHIQDTVNRMFYNSFGKSGLSGEAFFDPDIDIKENPSEYIITVDLPGIEKNKINLQTKDNMLIISGERDNEQVNEDEKGNTRFYRRERSFGSFSRAVPLPDDADDSKVSAEYKNGVLKIKVARKEIKNNPVQTGSNIKVL